MPEALVTGASTLIGGNVARALAQAGHRVRALLGPHDRATALEDIPIDLVRGDVASPVDVERALSGVGQVYHCAGVASLWSRLETAMRRTNLRGTDVVCDAARRAGARIVHVSSLDAIALPRGADLPDEDAAWNLGAHKLPCAHAAHEAELIVRDHIASGLDAVIVNPTYVLGPWDTAPTSGRLILAVARRRVPGYPAGGSNFVDARDVAQAMIQTMKQGKRGERYILGSENRSWHEILDLIADVVGAPRPRVRIPRSLALAAGAFGELWGGITGREPIVSPIEVRFAYLPRYCNTGRADRELHMQHTPLRQTVEDAWRWFKTHRYA